MPISSNINRISASHSGLKCVNLNVMSIVYKNGCAKENSR